MAGKNTPAKAPQGGVPDTTSGSKLEELFKAHGVMLPEEQDPETVAFEMARRVFDAETVDDILGSSQEVTHSRDLLDTNIFIDGCDFQSSDFDGGSGIYTVLTVRKMDEPTNPILVTCGSTTVIAQVLRAREIGGLPMACRIEQAAKPTKSGYYPIQLRKPQVVKVGNAPGSYSDEEPF